MRIKNIHLLNYRGMEDLTVDFGPGVNLIIGDNAAGKSSLLSGLSVALAHLLTGNGEPFFHMDKEDVRAAVHPAGDATTSVEYYTPTIVEGEFEFRGGSWHYSCRKDNEVSVPHVDIPSGKAEWDKMQEMFNDNSATLPLISYQNDERSLIPFDEAMQPDGQIERRQGYHNCLSGKPFFESVQNWCARMDYIGYKLKHEPVEYGLFKRIASRFITELTESADAVQVDFSPALNRLVYSEGGNSYFIHNLSAGYQSVLCLIMELAYRTALLNPRLDNLSSLEGVVLIDEIDLHLHPRWQWKILGALRATFPGVQFIIATHSPIVISSAEDAKLILMEGSGTVKELPDAYGYNIGDVLELAQSSMDMPQEVMKWRREIEQALDENDLPRAEGIVRAAEVKLGKDSSAVKRMRDFLEVNKWIVDE
ncbi:MAG: AAA family ATPase [Fretibacterium sp.]|nr:AAA family ATPase [Fretibacterium sp.]